MAASTRLSPCSWWRMMFSSTIIASSTTMPMERLRPRSVNVFKVKPAKYKKINVPTTEVGMENKTFTVEAQDPRKIQHTMAVRKADSSKVKFNSLTACSIYFVLSKFTSSFIPSGRPLRTSSILARIAFATPTAFEPRCLKIPRPTPGTPRALV